MHMDDTRRDECTGIRFVLHATAWGVGIVAGVTVCTWLTGDTGGGPPGREWAYALSAWHYKQYGGPIEPEAWHLLLVSLAALPTVVGFLVFLAVPIISWRWIIPRLIRWIVVRRTENRCRVCSYDLTGNVSGICPECGSPIEDMPDVDISTRRLLGVLFAWGGLVLIMLWFLFRPRLY
jgi:hypothetical protein